MSTNRTEETASEGRIEVKPMTSDGWLWLWDLLTLVLFGLVVGTVYYTIGVARGVSE